MNDKIIIDQIVNKIIKGEGNYLPEELQFQKNYPDRIEFALKLRQLNLSIWRGIDNYLIVPYNWTLDKICQAKSLLGLERCVSAPQSAALALFAKSDICGTICIITDDKQSLEICIIEIGEGVFEVLFTAWVESDIEDITAVCNIIHGNIKIERIGQIIYISDNSNSFHTAGFERFLGKPVLRLYGLANICNYGIAIHKNSDALLLDVLLPNQTIYIQTPIGDVIPMVFANTLIPTKKSKIFEIYANCGIIDLLILQGNNSILANNSAIGILHWDNVNDEKHEIDITVDIDAKNRIHITGIDKVSGKMSSVKFG